jgi:hypothetical protein
MFTRSTLSSNGLFLEPIYIYDLLFQVMGCQFATEGVRRKENLQRLLSIEEVIVGASKLLKVGLLMASLAQGMVTWLL